MLDKENNTPGSNVAIAGAASGFLTRFICQPLDVIKIRFQVIIILLLLQVLLNNIIKLKLNSFIF